MLLRPMLNIYNESFLLISATERSNSSSVNIIINNLSIVINTKISINVTLANLVLTITITFAAGIGRFSISRSWPDAANRLRDGSYAGLGNAELTIWWCLLIWTSEGEWKLCLYASWAISRLFSISCECR